MREVIASALFVTTIAILVLTREEKRYLVSLASAAIAIALGLVNLNSVIDYLNLDVLGLIGGACVVSAYLSKSGITEEVAKRALEVSKGDLRKLGALLGLTSGVISLFIENVTTLIMLAPVVFSIARYSEIDAVPLLLVVAFASNLGGAALLVGDPQSALAASYFNLDFIDFIVKDGKPSIFWMVLVGLIVSTLSFSYAFLKDTVDFESALRKLKGVTDSDLAKVSLTALGVKIFLLSIRKVLGIGLAPAALVAVAIILLYRRSLEDLKFSLQSVEWKLLLFLAGLFVLVGALEDSGVMKVVANVLKECLGCDYFVITSSIIIVSVIISSVMDNVPYLLAMFPVIESLSDHCHIYWFKLLLALLLGATLGGNVTYFGTSTNVAAVQLLAEAGYRVPFRRFVKLGLFYTIFALGPAVLIYYLIWS
ncbi:hypothetical protein EYM_05755 [Ignicoccus islandicus DSM 13165]|uniref:Citrate transporter-like domain-containing protein n=1 Tax=Ignicoccus islandicus DSM 13165 TaxID=940295 RepID=A0A0U3F9B9_9CREN|nr:SLC13 family permease [Ignicoccus islandicus]ALU12616.1 hypothetical protein EYM_05755 [Ignicoccus islandicus DSM 13165]